MTAARMASARSRQVPMEEVMDQPIVVFLYPWLYDYLEATGRDMTFYRRVEKLPETAHGN